VIRSFSNLNTEYYYLTNQEKSFCYVGKKAYFCALKYEEYCCFKNSIYSIKHYEKVFSNNFLFNHNYGVGNGTGGIEQLYRWYNTGRV